MQSYLKISSASKPEWNNGDVAGYAGRSTELTIKKYGVFWNKKDKVYNLQNDIKQCKMVSDSDTVISKKTMGGTLAGAAVGGLLTGGAGAIVGGMASGNKHSNIRKSQFAVEFNDGEFIVLELYSKGDMVGKILDLAFDTFVKQVRKFAVGSNPFAEA
tara:strand:+ start:45 stop:518 length:474 start_codon:yes stop_codon:yes gene_type:complete